VFCFFIGLPGLDYLPGSAVGCLSGKYGMVCSKTYPQTALAISYSTKKRTVSLFRQVVAKKTQ
jgi:hypothetical protein